MLHTPSEVIVHFSHDYERFEFIHGNRVLNKDKIKKIIREIESGNDMLKYYPIQVKESENGKLQIIDGQHRFTICKELKRCIYYINVREEKSIVDIAKVNSNVEKWKPADFLESYISSANQDYVALKNFIKEYPFNIGYATSLLMNGDSTSNNNKNAISLFQSGQFKVNFLAYATKVGECCNLFKPSQISFQRAFTDAIQKIINCGLVPIEDLAERVTAKIELLTDQGNYKNYIYKLEEIYNMGKHSRTIIYAKPEAPKKEPKKPKEEKPKIISRIIPQPRVQNNYRSGYRTNDDKTKFKTVADPTAGKMLLKIDSKTSIYIPKGADPVKEREKFLKSEREKGRDSLD